MSDLGEQLVGLWIPNLISHSETNFYWCFGCSDVSPSSKTFWTAHQVQSASGQIKSIVSCYSLWSNTQTNASCHITTNKWNLLAGCARCVAAVSNMINVLLLLVYWEFLPANNNFSTPELNLGKMDQVSQLLAVGNGDVFVSCGSLEFLASHTHCHFKALRWHHVLV